MKKIHYLVLSSILGLSVAGCSDGPHGDIQAWMKEQENAVSPRVPPVEEPKAFVPVVYESYSGTAPFEKRKLLDVLRAEIQSDSNSTVLLERESKRRKEALEGYPLDSLSYVGFLSQNGKNTALIRVNASGLIFKVKAGNYAGQNYGLIRSVSESEIVLREIVQDSLGEWIEQDQVIYLQEDEQS